MLRFLNRLVTAVAILVVVSLVLSAWLLYRQPRWALDVATRWSGDRMLFYFNTDEPVVALTIDDGPDPDTTAEILAVLQRHDAKATFFLIGEHVAGNEMVMKEAIAAGMEVGNHMMKDRMSLTLVKTGEFSHALEQAEETITDAAGVETLEWFRPGQGLFNRQMLELVEGRGYRSILGSTFPYDTLLGDPEFSARFILNRVQPGSAIVLHDRGDRGQRTATTLEILLPELKKRGYRVTTLSELAELEGQ